MAGKAKFPVLLFSHGWGNPTFLYTAELEDLVSHGDVVAAIEHFNEAVKKAHGFIDYARELVQVMAEDNRFALDQLVKLNRDRSLHSPFVGRLGIQNVGAFGHSIGGLASARACQIDARIRACIDQDSADDRGSAFIATDLDEVASQPFLLFVVADIWSPGVMGFTHRSFSDLPFLAKTPNYAESLHNFELPRRSRVDSSTSISREHGSHCWIRQNPLIRERK